VRFLVKTLEIERPLNYHFLVFAVAIPLIFFLEYYYSTYNALFFFATFVGALVAEDFLWFLLNWHFDSRTQLLKGPHGSIWWHKRWIRISKKHYVPACYFLALLLSVSMFFAAQSDTYAAFSKKITWDTLKSIHTFGPR
jgi:hypothetical protein